MLLAALGFSIMGGAAKALKGSFNAGQLVFYRNAVGLLIILLSFTQKSTPNKGGKLGWLLFRGLMGTIALYTLLYCILHIPLGTAMSYNLTSALFIALFSFILWRNYTGKIVLASLAIGFVGMLLIYKPNMNLHWHYHVAGLISGITSTLAYLTVGKLTQYYHPRTIVLSFVLTGVLVPILLSIIRIAFSLQTDDLFFNALKWPAANEIGWILLLGLSALFGQYFVTRAYGAEKAEIVAVFGYANIIFSVFIGMLLGDSFPDPMSWAGILCIISSGVLISLFKKRGQNLPIND